MDLTNMGPVKICRQCQIEKPLSNFARGKSYKDGHRGQCQTCRTAYSRQYNNLRRIDDRDIPMNSNATAHTKVCIGCQETKLETAFGKDSAKVYRVKGLCKTCKRRYNYAWNLVYTERIKTHGPNWMMIPADVTNAMDECLARINPCRVNTIEKEKAQIYGRAHYQKYGLTPLGKFASYQREAEQRNLAWELSLEQFLGFWQVPCEYCGASIDTIGLDRKNNELGYLLSNVVPCCKGCNVAKMKRPQEDFIAMCHRVAKLHSVVIDSTINQGLDKLEKVC